MATKKKTPVSWNRTQDTLAWKKAVLAGSALGSALLASGCKRPGSDGSSTQFASGFHIDTLQPAPSNLDRDFTCPTSAKSLEADVGGRRFTYQRAGSPTPAESWNALSSLLAPIASADDLKLTAILVRRINGVPHYLSVSNGTQAHVFQPWSSSKHMAFAALASTLRAHSNGAVGLDSEVSDPNGGRVHVGDLVTEATSYEFSCWDPRYCKGARHIPHLSSNNVSIWAKNLAGRQFANDLITKFLGRTGERFDGGYDKTMTGSGWGSQFTDANGDKLTLSRSSVPTGAANLLSTQTMAEFLRRMVMLREDPQTAIPNAQWNDMATIFYGAPQSKSKYFPHYKAGGMLGGAGDYIQNAVSGSNIKALEDSTLGQWRSFAKVGWGPGSSSGNDFAWHGYGCIPRFDPVTMKALPSGKEFIISAALKGKPGASDASRDALLARAVKAVVLKIMDGTLDRTPSLSTSVVMPTEIPTEIPTGTPTETPTATPMETPTITPMVSPTPDEPSCNPFLSLC
ncbi:MAG: hypothetical protein IOD12_13985 [Silvanigrellales bacterium]|nr:hypothetical protein [Silvanigrellales bacterium]